MAVFVIDSSESFATDFADKRSFARMYSDVHVQSIQLGKTFAANVTIMASLAGVNGHVAGSVFDACEFLVANLAFKWFFTGVQQLMTTNLEVGITNKTIEFLKKKLKYL